MSMEAKNDSSENGSNADSILEEKESGAAKDMLPLSYRDVSKPARGALKLEVATSTPVITAGSEFSIFVIIRNPFPVPITIYSTRTHIPVELSDEIWRKSEAEKRISERTRLIKEMTKNPYKRIFMRFGYWLLDLLNLLRTEPGPRIAIAVSTELNENPYRVAPVIFEGDINFDAGGSFIGRDVNHFNFGDKSREEIRQILFEVEEFRAGRKTILLRPGDSVVNHFVIKTTKWLFFTPIAHTFQIQVRYEVDGEDHLDTVPYSLSLRASTTSSMIGAVIGSIMGSMVNDTVLIAGSPDSWRIILTAIIFAVIVIIAFARKSAVQQIVSVEDFWGGVFIGFLVGYTGESFIRSIIIP